MRKQFSDAERSAIETFIANNPPTKYPPYVRHYRESEMNNAVRAASVDTQMRAA